MLRSSLTALALACCTSAAELRQQDEATCASRGFQAGTPEFSACLKQEAAARRCADSATASLHIKPHPGFPSCPNDPA